jgi:hypothetical protein
LQPTTRYVKDEVILEFPNVPTLITAVAASHNMTLLATGTYFGRTVHRWHIDSGVAVADMITSTSADRQIGGAQPNYLYRLAQTDQVPINA